MKTFRLTAIVGTFLLSLTSISSAQKKEWMMVTPGGDTLNSCTLFAVNDSLVELSRGTSPILIPVDSVKVFLRSNNSWRASGRGRAEKVAIIRSLIIHGAGSLGSWRDRISIDSSIYAQTVSDIDGKGSSGSNAQFKKGDFELSFSGSLGSMNSKTTYSESSTYGGYSNSNNESNNYFSISIIPGYYLLDGFSVEPEISLLAVQHSAPAQYLLLNLSYTYLLPNSEMALFLRGGYGVSNAVQIPIMGGIIGRSSDKLDIGVFNVGAGTKFLVSQSVILRVELNYRSHAWSESQDDVWGSYSTNNSISNVGVFIGFSILL